MLSKYHRFLLKIARNLSSDAQKIQHYASEITKTDSSSLLKADDPAIKLKEALIGKLPQNRRQEIVKANAKQCIQLALDEGGSDRDILLKTAAWTWKSTMLIQQSGLFHPSTSRGGICQEKAFLFFPVLSPPVFFRMTRMGKGID